MRSFSSVTEQQSFELLSACELRDLLASERAERLHLQDELNLRTCALEATETHFMILDVSEPSWTIVYANRAICEAHGFSSSEILGQSPLMLICAEESGPALARVREAVVRGANVGVEFVARRKDNTKFSIGMSMMPLVPVAQGVTHYVCVGANISLRLAHEQERERMAIELRLAQKLESVGRLAAGIAHEINTPIQYVGDSVTFLQSAETELQSLRNQYRRAIARLAEGEPAQVVLPEIRQMESSVDLEFMATEIPRAFERTLEGVERVAAIVRAMKEFAHPDSAQHAYADLNHAIETTLTVAHNEYKYHAQVETRFGPLPLVNCDVGELNQVFLNLIVNAAHALAEAGQDSATGRITITTCAAGEHVSISIADNGCGIPQHNLEKVFDPFFTTKPVGRGTGQGLAIARAIVVEKHAGRIDVASTVGAGTTFTLQLPVKGREMEGQ